MSFDSRLKPAAVYHKEPAYLTEDLKGLLRLRCSPFAWLTSGQIFIQPKKARQFGLPGCVKLLR